jgi:hypothetical protein
MANNTLNITVRKVENGHIISIGDRIRVVPDGENLSDAITVMLVSAKLEG